MKFRRKTSGGFTLIELLVVISIIALLMAILMPSLAKVRQLASAVTCSSNMKQLSYAWFMYQGDNNGKLISGCDDDPSVNNPYPWIGVPRDDNGNKIAYNRTSPPVTDEDEIRGIKEGLLFKYLTDPQVYHCSADTKRKSIYDGTKVFVSYSIPRCLNGNPGAGSTNQIIRFEAIRQPATKYNFVETAETRNFNMGHRFQMGAPEYTGQDEFGWHGPMAVNHGDKSNLGFADGHAESHKWKDKFTIDRVQKLITQQVEWYDVEYPPDNQQEDIKFMADGWAFRK